MKSKSNYFAIGLVLALALAGVFWALYYDPGTQKVSELQAQLEGRRQTLATMRGLAAQVPQLETEIAQAEERIEAISKKLAPPALTYGEAMAALKGLADRLNLTFEQVQPIPDEAAATDALSFLQFDVGLEGKPRATYDYLASVERAPIYLLVPGATFSASGKGVRAQIRVLVPVFPEKEVRDGPQASFPQ